MKFNYSVLSLIRILILVLLKDTKCLNISAIYYNNFDIKILFVVILLKYCLFSLSMEVSLKIIYSYFNYFTSKYSFKTTLK